MVALPNVSRHLLSFSLCISFFIQIQSAQGEQATAAALGKSSEKVLTVGAIIPLTGTGVRFGNAIRSGIELGLSDLPESARNRIKVVYEDDKNSPKFAVAGFKKLTTQDQVDAVISFSANPGMALAPLADAARVPMVSISLPPKTVKGRKYSVLFYATAEGLATSLMEESVRLGYKRIARVSAIHEGRIAMKELFDQMNKGRIEVAIDEDYPLEIKDFKDFLTKVRARGKLDAIYVNLFIGQVGQFAKQARELGITLPLITTEFFQEESEQASAQGALDNQWYVTEADATPEFLARYKERFPKESLFAAPNGYDIITILGKAAEAGLDKEGVNNLFHNLKNHRGALGEYSSTGDGRTSIPAQIKIVPRLAQ